MPIRKRLLSVLLAGCMLLAMLPGTALAEEDPAGPVEQTVESDETAPGESDEPEETTLGESSEPVETTPDEGGEPEETTPDESGELDETTPDESGEPAGGTDDVIDPVKPVESTNAGGQTAYYFPTVTSYLYENSSGGVTRVEYISRKVIIEEYSAGYKLQSQQEIELELPSWGGFFAGEKYNFLISGDNNPDHTADTEVYRVEKYDKNWQKLDSASVKGANTARAFAFGSLRCAEYDNMLYIHTCHDMYNGHQACMLFQVREDDMRITSNSRSYVSHSLNQSALVDSQKNLILLDQGDAYPRGLILYKYSGQAGNDQLGGCSSTKILSPGGRVGLIQTGFSIGGVAETENGYVTAYNYDGVGTNTGPRNIFLAFTPRNLKGTETKQITDVQADGGNCSAPVLISTGLEGGYVLWNDRTDGTLYYARYEAGGTVGETQTANGLLSKCQPIVLSSGTAVWYTTNRSGPVFYTLTFDEESGETVVTEHPAMPEDCPHFNWKLLEEKEATCAAEGFRKLECEKCGLIKTEILMKLPHTPDIDPDNDKNGFSGNGNKTHTGYCTECGFIENESCNYYYPDKETGEVGKIIKEPSCSEPGKRLLTCSVCASEKTEDVRKLPHTPTKTTPKNLGNGTHSVNVCEKCGAICKTETHRLTNLKINKDGTHSGTCTVCNASGTENCSFDTVEVTREPTCTEEGLQTVVCIVCGYEKNETIAKTDHIYIIESTATCTEEGEEITVCADCGDIKEEKPIARLEHKYQEEVVPATCIEEGREATVCANCGDIKEEKTLDRVAHNYQEEITPATCTEDGKRASVCTNCGDENILETYSALGHEYNETIMPATCTGNGVKTIACINCDDEKTEVIPATGHTFEKNDDGNYVCTNAWDQDEDNKPLTVIPGSVKDAYEDVLEELEKEPDEAPVKATESVKSETAAKEYVEKLVKDLLDADGSTGLVISVEKVSYQEPKEGVEGQYVYRVTFSLPSGDGTLQPVMQTPELTLTLPALKKDTSTPPSNPGGTTTPSNPHTHRYSVAVTKKPTCTETGIQTARCSCGSVKTEILPATEHSYKVQKETAATCTEDGKKTEVCANCNDIRTTETAAKGHNLVLNKKTGKYECRNELDKGGNSTLIVSDILKKGYEAVKKAVGKELTAPYRYDSLASAVAYIDGLVKKALDSVDSSRLYAEIITVDHQMPKDEVDGWILYRVTIYLRSAQRSEDASLVTEEFRIVLPANAEIPPVEPDPVDPDPVDPDPVDPSSVDPDPVDPDPVNPDPVEPDPVDPDPVKPDPVDPDPIDPDPVDPDPVDPDDSNSKKEESYYISVSAVTGGEVIPNTRRAKQGSRVSLSVHPDSGYELDDLTVTNSRGREISLRGSGNSFSFTMPASRVTIAAKFKKTPETTPSSGEDEPFTGLGTPGASGIVLNPSPMPFLDIQDGDWYYSSVDYVWKHYLMSGVSETQFAPAATTSRAMIWTVLARMHNVRTDVNPGGTWYERGMLWAMEQGVTDGSNPLSSITREQLAVMLWRNAGAPSSGGVDMSRFADFGSVSSYAQAALCWTVDIGVMNGANGLLNPQGTATRAEVAAMIMRYGELPGV